ncbi:hypothetical protein CPC08DRAFT_824838 [Agrocybe pediades]|nr:hypothetical protein CPC08DRAFT_824838 [Agrocybe pediades]
MRWLLTECPALEELRVVERLLLDIIQPKPPPFENPHLKTLSLRNVWTTIRRFTLHGNLTEKVVKMLMERLPHGRHKYVPTAKYLNVTVDGPVEDIITSSGALEGSGRVYAHMKGTVCPWR